MNHPTPLCRALGCALCLAVIAVAAPAWADNTAAPARPSVQALPDSTLGVAHLPDPTGYANAMRQRTMLGQLIFSPEQRQRIEDFIAEHMKDADADLAEGLRRYGLEKQDLPQLVSGPMGLAVCVVEETGPAVGDRPLFMLLAWIEPGDELAARTLAAAETLISEWIDEGGDEAPVRVDLDLVGHTVIRLTQPVVRQDCEMPPYPDDFHELSDEERRAFLEKMHEDRMNSPVVEVNRRYSFITRIGPRLVVAFAPDQGGSLASSSSDSRPTDLDALTGMEAFTGQFARFLAAHHDSEGGPFVQRMLATPGLAAALPARGDVGLELLADLRRLVRTLLRFDESDGQATHWVSLLGLDQLGPFAWRGVLDGHVMRDGALLSARVPRPGLLAWLDQQPLASEPPAWVPAAVTQYAHLSFDLGAAYSHVKQLVIDAVGQEAIDGFAMAEGQSAQMFGADIATTLSSLGRQHSVVQYAMRIEEVELPHWEQGDDGQYVQTTRKRKLPVQRQGMVWQPSDATLGQRLIQAISPFAPMTGGALQFAQEQGFTGWRMEEGPMRMALFAGKGFLTLCIGPDVTSPLLNALSQPPAAADALLHSPLMRQGREILQLEPAVAFYMTDTGRYMRAMLDVYARMLESVHEDAVQGDSETSALPESHGRLETAASLLRDLLPSLDELEDAMGVSIGTTLTTDDGMVGRSALWLTPAIPQ